MVGWLVDFIFVPSLWQGTQPSAFTFNDRKNAASVSNLTYSLMEPNKGHIRFLDHIRGIAILAVFVYHAFGAAWGCSEIPWNHWFRSMEAVKNLNIFLPLVFGWTGVAVFFVVSGFCVHMSYLKSSPDDLRGFFIRRFFRIYPPYLLALFVFTFLWPSTRLTFHSFFDWIQVGSHVGLIHNLNKNTFFQINPSFWSIAVEAQLYLIYPLLLLIVRRIGWQRATVGLCVLEITMRGTAGIYETATAKQISTWFMYSPLCYWFSWGIGAIVADAYFHRRKLPFLSVKPFFWLLLGVGTYFVKPFVTFTFFFFALFTAALISKLLRDDRKIPYQNVLFDHLRIVGMCSYSMYLLHQPLLISLLIFLQDHKVNMHFQPVVLVLIFFSTYPIVLAVSWIYFRYCETPSIALGKKLLNKTRGFGPVDKGVGDVPPVVKTGGWLRGFLVG